MKLVHVWGGGCAMRILQLGWEVRIKLFGVEAVPLHGTLCSASWFIFSHPLDFQS